MSVLYIIFLIMISVILIGLFIGVMIELAKYIYIHNTKLTRFCGWFVGCWGVLCGIIGLYLIIVDLISEVF